jgi:DNA repair exonuclease SbcCD ATPase subunit
VVDTTTCPVCGKGGFATPGYVRTHMAHAHKRVKCPVCEQETSPAMANRHLASHYRQADSVGQLRRDNARLRAEVEKLRQEVTDWQALAQEAIDLL